MKARKKIPTKTIITELSTANKTILSPANNNGMLKYTTLNNIAKDSNINITAIRTANLCIQDRLFLLKTYNLTTESKHSLQVSDE